MKKDLSDAFLVLFKYGAKIYNMPSGDQVIHVGKSTLEAVAEDLLTQRCGIQRATMDGKTVLILRKEQK